MDENNSFIYWVGWCKETTNGVNHDKIWAILKLQQNRYACVWGRRGKKLSTKVMDEGTYSYELDKLIRSKKNIKHYVQCRPGQLDQVYPEFQEDLEKTALWTTLCL